VRPPYLVRWDDDALESQRKVALDRFIEQRSKGADPEYARHFQACRGLVQSLFDTTRDLRDFNPEKMESAQLLNAARFLSVPPWSEDDLATVSGTDVTKRKTVPRAVLESAVRVLQVGWDRDRFPWISADREPSPQERDIAVRWTASIWAIERLRTERRLESSKEQQAAVESLLSKIGYSKDPAKEIKWPHSLSVGKFAAGAILADHQCDVAVRLPDERLVAIECKVSNSSLNSIKRLINDAGVKARDWRARFGDAVVPAVVLSGVYKLINLQRAQREFGMSIFWDHDLEALHRALPSPAGNAKTTSGRRSK